MYVERKRRSGVAGMIFFPTAVNAAFRLLVFKPILIVLLADCRVSITLEQT
jgi:hypothetical protein